MIRIGKRDRVFVAVLVPLALLGGYFHLVRQPLAKERGALAAARAELPDPDMFPVERRALQGRVAEAGKDLDAAKGEPAPESAVRGEAGAPEAARLQAVVDVLRAHGACLVKAEPVEAEGLGADVLRATGVRPDPVARRMVLEASYPVLVETLGDLENRRLAVVPCAWSMSAGETACRWEVTLWL